MTGLRQHGVIGLILLLWTAGHCEDTAVTVSSRDEQNLFDRIMDIVKRAKGCEGESGEATPRLLFNKDENPTEPKELQDYKSYDNHVLEIYPRDLKKKEKFLKHLTGPLYFSPKCRKHVYRLYHNTRDCTIPAYYKRCARLLTRLANSARCTES